jgi:DNA-repair protein XRCC1
MAGKAGEEDDDEDEAEVVRWSVTNRSSEAEVHPASNVLNPDHFRLWQTLRPCEEAWLELEPRPPAAFSRVEIVNAGSSLVEIQGLRDGSNGDDNYELLLSPQQVMTVKDLTSKANRNRALTFDIDANRKLSPVAAQQRWRKVRIQCRQPFGTNEHRACIGLAYVNFTTCKPKSETGGSKRRVLHSGDKLLKKPKQQNVEYPKRDVKPEPHDYASLSLESPRTDVKVVKPKLVIGSATSDPSECQAFRLASAPFPRKGHGTTSKVKSKMEDVEEETLKVKSKMEDVKEETAVSLQAPKQDRNVDIGVNAAQGVGISPHQVDAKRFGDAPPSNSAQEAGKGSSSIKTITANGDFAKVLEGVVFAISGIQNPARGLFRTQGLEMGAQYRPDWTSDCTVLICAFKDTPKFKQVKADGGTIVAKEWISECHKQRKLVSIERFFMHNGRPWRNPVLKVSCGSLQEVQQWAYDDLASTCTWLQQRDPKPKPEEMDLTAAQGIMVCFEDTIKCIQDNQGVRSIIESWGCLPKAIQELAAMEEGRDGYKKGTRSHMLEEATRLKHVYTDILNPIFVACSKRPESAKIKKKR